MAECSECDRRASAFWGRHAYCSSCLVDAQRADPDAQKCPTCGEQQGSQIMWRGEDCGACKSRKREVRS